MDAQEFGKTIFISILAKLIKNQKILILDFDLKNNNLHSIFGVKQIPKDIKNRLREKEFLSEFKLKESNIQRLSIRINKNIKIVSATKLIFDDKYKYDQDRIIKMIDELQKHYELILIDTSSDSKYEQINNVIAKLSNKIICLIEGNIISLKKSIALLEKFSKERRKIKIIYNKKNKYTLCINIIRIVFLRFKMIGSLHYDIAYNKIINNNVKTRIINKNIKVEFEKIKKQLQIK